MSYPLFVMPHSGSKIWKYLRLGLSSILLSLFLISFSAIASQAHWADLSTAEIDIRASSVDATVTLPTQWVTFADQNQDQQLSLAEIQNSRDALETFLGDRLPFTNRQQPADVIVLSTPEAPRSDDVGSSVPVPPNAESSIAPTDTHQYLNLAISVGSAH